MSRYSNAEKDYLYDEICEYLQKMQISDFLEVLTDVIRNSDY